MSNFNNELAAGLVLGVMVIPTIASLAEDSMTAVPQALRQGSLAMGANRMQTTIRVVLPAAISGVTAAIVLGMSRAVGETMIVTLAAGAQKTSPCNPMEGAQAMTGFIAQTAGGENPVGSVEYNTLFAVGAPLFAMTLVLQHHQHPHRPRYGRPTDMSIAASTAREITGAIASGKRKDRNAGSSSSSSPFGSRSSSASWSCWR